MRDDEKQNPEFNRAFESIAQCIRDSAAEPPETLKASVMLEIRQRRRRRRAAARGLAIAACFAVVVFAGLGFGLFSGARGGSAPSLASGVASGEGIIGNNQPAATPGLAPDPDSVPMPTPSALASGTDLPVTGPATNSDLYGQESPAPSPGPGQSSLLDLHQTALYAATSSGLYEPLLKNMDDATVAALMAYLDLQQVDPVQIPMKEYPDFILDVKQADGSMTQRNFWVSGDNLYCDSPDDTYIYIAACTPAEFTAYVLGLTG